MVPIKTDGDCRPLGPPKDWDEEQSGYCATLWVEDVPIGNGESLIVSTWAFATPQERQDFIDGKSHLRIGWRGPFHPVISVWAE